MAVSYSILIDWNDDGDFSDTYENVTVDAIQTEWFVGQTDPYGYVAPPGWCKIELNNAHMRYTPQQSAADIRIGKQVVIQSNDGMTTRTHWTGFLWTLECTGGYLSPRRAYLVAYTWDTVLDNELVTLPIQLDKRTNAVIETILNSLHPRYAVLDEYLIIGAAGRNIIGTHKIFSPPPISFAPYGDFGTGLLRFAYLGDTYAAGISARAAISDLVEAEIGRWWVNEDGEGQFAYRFAQFVWSTVDGTVSTGIDLHYAQGTHLKNIVQVDVSPREIGADGTVLWTLANYQRLNPLQEITLTAPFRDAQKRPAGALSVIEPVYGVDFTLNTQANGLGLSVPASAINIRVDSETGGSSARLILSNQTGSTFYVHSLQVRGQIIEFPDPVRIESIDYFSRTLYFPRLLQQRNLALQDVDMAQEWADFQRARRGTAARLLGVTLTTIENQTQVLARRVYDRVTVTDTALDESADYFIVGTHHVLDRGRHTATWSLTYADDQIFFVIGESLIDGDHVLA